MNHLYTADQTRKLDRLAIEEAGVSGLQLLKKAGESAFHYILSAYPQLKQMTVICGIGNNGGDGYVIALLAKQHGYNVNVIQLGDLAKQVGDALTVRKELEGSGVLIESYQQQDFSHDEIIVDAILGTGLQRSVDGEWASAIEAINQSSAQVISIDVPSGLNADTGKVHTVGVKADMTVTFIGRKQGLYTADGCDLSGTIQFDDLTIPEKILKQIKPKSLCLAANLPKSLLKARQKNSHKGSYGSVILIGGSPGMNGAILLSAIAALRSGCGLVTVLTHPSHAAFLNLMCPEIMCVAIENNQTLDDNIKKADAIVIGPGLGSTQWGKDLLHSVLKTKKPLLIDADGLNNLPDIKSPNKNWVLTPHPGEAARLLAVDIDEIQNDRFDAVKKISEKYQAICVLKGAGTLIRTFEETYVCTAGNPGMATAGMGDVLSGVIGALMAQGVPQKMALEQAVVNSVMLHALAGDKVAEKYGEKGMMASDLFLEIRSLLNAK